jgi:cytochrome c oxidase subunit 1
VSLSENRASAAVRTPRSILARLFTSDHRVLGRRYLLLSLFAVIAGTLLSLAMRIQLAWPGIVLFGHGPMLPEQYLSLVTMHGTLMVFFVLTTAPQSAFAGLVLPEQIGARRMALPVLNAAGFWIVALALAVLPSPAGPAIPHSAPSPAPVPARAAVWTSGSSASGSSASAPGSARSTCWSPSSPSAHQA